MPPMREHIRLYVNAPLCPGEGVVLSREQAHYLRKVMRRSDGDRIGLFNGRDGEWRAIIQTQGKQDCTATPHELIQPQTATPDLWLICALIKRTRLEIVAEKAAELGVREIHPVLTEYTNAPPMKVERLCAITIEAAEQCGLVSVPKLLAPEKLQTILDGWPAERRILFCDESGAGKAAIIALQSAARERAPWAVLTGPEGGFSPAERARLLSMPQTLAVSLGPRILRADTAAISALALWQSVCGDWDTGPVALADQPV